MKKVIINDRLIYRSFIYEPGVITDVDDETYASLKKRNLVKDVAAPLEPEPEHQEQEHTSPGKHTSEDATESEQKDSKAKRLKKV